MEEVKTSKQIPEETSNENQKLIKKINTLNEDNRRFDEQVFDLFTIAQAGKVFIANPNIERLSELMLAIIQERFGSQKLALLLKNDDGTLYEIRHTIGMSEKVKQEVKYIPHEGMFWQLIANGEAFSVLNIEGKSRFEKIFTENKLDRLHSCLWLPLKTPEGVIGIVTLGKKEKEEEYSQLEVNFLNLLASQASAAFQSAKLYDKVANYSRELDKQMHSLSMLYDISKALNFIDDLTKLLAMILDQAIAVIEAEKGSLMLLDDKTDELVVRVVRGIDKVVEQKILDGEIQCTKLKRGEGIAGKVLVSGKPVLIDDVSKETQFKEAKQTRVDSILCVPLKIGDDPIGVINITNKKYGKKFNQDDLKILNTLAEQAAVAINNARLYELAITDGLTKLFIRRHFMQLLFEELNRSRRYNRKITLIIADIDHFKGFNDTYGHQVGDLVLVEIAKIFRHNVRLTDKIGRYGGEEFCIMLPETEIEGGMILAERLKQATEECKIIHEERVLKVTASFGVSEFPKDANEIEKLIKTADLALYEAKLTGRNRVVQFEERLWEKSDIIKDKNKHDDH